MKKYRLLQTLLMPGHLPIILPIGYEVNLKGDLYIGEGGWYFAKTGVENNKLHWEEVNTVEKPEIDWDGISNQTRKYEYNSDAAEFLKNQFKILQNSLNPEPSSKKEEGWEIVEIVDTYYSNSIISKENKLGIYSLKDYLTKYEKGRFKINAVLRKSDNTVFTVGDEVGYKINDTKFIVKTIKISGEPYLLDGDTFHKHLLPLRNAIKAPTNTVEDSPFVWTDELVEDYSTKKALDFSFNTPTEARTNIERFKKSKTSNQ